MELESEENIELQRGDLKDEPTQDTEKYTQYTINSQTDLNSESSRRPFILKSGQSAHQEFLRPNPIKKRHFSLKENIKRNSLSGEGSGGKKKERKKDLAKEIVIHWFLFKAQTSQISNQIRKKK